MFAKKKLKREDFLFQNGWFQDKIKKPGELQMQQFQISDCQECNIFLFDSCACVYVDQCKYCTIFIGACESSVFVRDCHHLTIICATQQFRVRDCFECQFSIFCQSQPIIQSSYDILISCYPSFGYVELQKHMKEAKTNPWNNNWFDVYDFTPKKFNKINFQLSQLSPEQWKKIYNKLKRSMTQIGLKQSKRIIPRVSGRQQSSIQKICVLVVYPVQSSTICGETPIIQSRQHRIVSEQQTSLMLNIPQKDGKSNVLFLKIEKNQLPNWRKILNSITKQVLDLKLLELYENTVFAPFKDEH